MRLFLSAGEASGDAYAAEIMGALERKGAFDDLSLSNVLVNEVLAETAGDLQRAAKDVARTYSAGQGLSPHPGAYVSASELATAVAALVESGQIDRQRLLKESVSAIGGRRLSESGVGLVADSSTWGAVGIIESLGVAPRVYEGYQTAKSVLRISGPGLFVPIDFGYLNIRLAREAKKAGWRVLYFVPPGSWRKEKQGADLPGVADALVCPFPWSAEILRSMGANAFYFGHPLREMVARAVFEGEREGLAILPGSRLHEVARNMDVIAEATRGLDIPLKFAVASSLDASEVERQWEDLGGVPAEFTRDTYRVLKSSRSAIVCSGTATLEAALCHCPTVVVYRLSPLAELEYYIRRPKFKFVALPNILLDRPAVPELLQHAASPERIRAEVVALLEDGELRQAQLQAFAEIEARLSGDDVFGQTADLAISLGS